MDFEDKSHRCGLGSLLYSREQESILLLFR